MPLPAWAVEAVAVASASVSISARRVFERVNMYPILASGRNGRASAPKPLQGPSPVVRETQIHARSCGLRPARGHDLRSGVEGDPLGPVDVARTEQRGFPAAERVVRH